MNRNEAIEEINNTQDYYVNELLKIINNVESEYDAYKNLKEINFTSPTGTGKTIMMCKLINLLPNIYFVITTLSRGQLKIQIKNSIKKHSKYDNFNVYGLNDYTKASKLTEIDILNDIPLGKDFIWIRDEGHISTNRWQEVLRDKSKFIINFSATNKNINGIQCNFTHTMMLRTVSQNVGTPEDAIRKLIDVKNAHRNVKGYNPCALFRVLNDNVLDNVIKICDFYKLKYINITNEDFDMSEICSDDNENDVIINKFKITEGIDLKRCHVIYMDTKPNNESTTVQIIGRARRNALLWRQDIDIFKAENKKLLNETRQSFIYYNIPETKLAESNDGEILFSLCDRVSVEDLKCDTTIKVDNGQLTNGLFVLELLGKTGKFRITKDEETGFNVVDNESFYNEEYKNLEKNVIDLSDKNLNIKKIYVKNNINDFFKVLEKKACTSIDNYKLLYKYTKKICRENNIIFDWGKWDDKFYFNVRDNIIDKNVWEEFYKDFKNYFDLDEYARKNNTDFYRFKYSELHVDCLVNFPELYKYCDKRSIFSNSWYYAKLSFDFLVYIEKMEVVDIDYDKKIKDFLIEKKDYVKKINNNKFIVSNHPLTRALISREIYSLEELSERINQNKSSFIGYSVAKWKLILKSINTFDELDYYETSYLSLSELNKVFSLKMTKKELNHYLSGTFPLKTIHPIKPIDIFRYDIKSEEYVYSTLKSFYIYKTQFDNLYHSYNSVFNNKEIAIIGTDLMRYTKTGFVENTAVTSKITKYCKLNRFLTNKYKEIIESSHNYLFTGKNGYLFDKKCNTCLGYCVEYYAKYKLYGEKYFKKYLLEAQKEAKCDAINNSIIVRACMLMYKELMSICYGSNMKSIIQTISVESLVKKEYESFVNTVIRLGEKTANYVESQMHIKESLAKGDLLYNANLSVNHISALCDFINNDTILDVKVTNNIDVRYIKQVLAYYHLSKYRSDLNIKKLIIFDATSGRSIVIEISDDEFKITGNYITDFETSDEKEKNDKIALNCHDARKTSNIMMNKQLIQNSKIILFDLLGNDIAFNSSINNLSDFFQMSGNKLQYAIIYNDAIVINDNQIIYFNYVINKSKIESILMCIKVEKLEYNDVSILDKYNVLRLLLKD